MLQALKNTIKKTVFKIVKPPEAYNPSFSQAGEDAVIDFLFQGKNMHQPSYLELGVFMPVHGNNTFKFYLKGGKGLLVEADPSLIQNIKAQRPNDTILNIGVGLDGATEADFYVFNLPAISTFNKEEAESLIKSGAYQLMQTIKVPLQNINQIIKTHFKSCPDFLSIDIEGLDLEVLKSLDTVTHPIPVICAETCTYSENHIKPKDTRIEKLMLEKGYFVYADTYINTIFVHKEWFQKIV